MSTLFDIFGFLSVVLRGLDLVAQSILLGSVSFALFIAAPLASDAPSGVRTIAPGVRYCIQAAALAEVVRRYARRIKLLHIKDGPGDPNKRDLPMTAVGHARQMHTLPTLSRCPLPESGQIADRLRTQHEMVP